MVVIFAKKEMVVRVEVAAALCRAASVRRTLRLTTTATTPITTAWAVLAVMGGPNLEVFKFGVYVFFPVVVYWHFGDPQWYESNVAPVRDQHVSSLNIMLTSKPVQSKALSSRET